MTHLAEQGRKVLTGPVALVVQRADAAPAAWKGSGVTFTKQAPGAAAWRATRRGRSADAWTPSAQMDFDGNIEFTVAVARLAGDRRRRHPPRDSRRGRRRPVPHGPRLQRREAAGQPRLEVGRQEQPGLGLDWRHQRRPAVHAEGRQVRPAAEHQLLHAQAAGDAGLVVQRRQGRMPAGGEGRGHVPGELLQRRPHHRAGRRRSTYNFRLLLTPFKPIDTDRPVQHALLPRVQAGRRGACSRAPTWSTCTTRTPSIPTSTTRSSGRRR